LDRTYQCSDRTLTAYLIFFFLEALFAGAFFFDETTLFKCFIEAQLVNVSHTTATLSVARGGLAATSSGELVFFGGGYNGGLQYMPSNQVDICNVTSGIWTTATLSVPRAELAATSSGYLVFFAGGWNSNYGFPVYYNRVDIYNISNGSWSTATLSQARIQLAAASVGNFVLFGGGYNSSSPFNAVDIYYVASNMWTIATLSQARYFLSATSVANRYAIFAGGYDGAAASNVVDVFDSQSGMWSTATLSEARCLLAAASLGNLAFFGGGLSGLYGPGVNIVDIFNLTAQSWSTATLSYARGDFAASATADIVVFGGGTTNRITSLSFVDIYVATSNVWLTTNLSQTCAYLSSTASTNKIFFGGGWHDAVTYCYIVDIFEAYSQSLLSPQLQSPSSSNSQISVIDIVGIVIGIVALLIVSGLILLAILFLKQIKRRRQTFVQSTPSDKEKQNATVLNEYGNQHFSVNAIVAKQSNQNELTLVTETILLQPGIKFSELIVEKELGEGSYGHVYLGKWHAASVALKFCKQRGKMEEFMNEIKLMTNLPPHPNIIHVYGVSLDGPQPVIVMEYCGGGSLDKLLFDSNMMLNDDQKIQLVHGIAVGMLHLHRHNIVHRDLAARNILLTSSLVPKISDFGLSRILAKTNEGRVCLKNCL